MKDLIVKHKTFGEGKVCAVEGNRVSVSFADAEKIFSAEHFFDFFTTDPETAETLKREIDAELEAERQRERERKRKEEEEKREKARLLEEEARRPMVERREAARLIEEERLRKKEEERAQEEFARRKELLEKLKSYGFEGFLHTTEFENFRKIIESGYLRSRTDLKNAGARFIDRADLRVLGNTDTGIKNFARFYYRFGTPTNFDAHYSRPVTLVFDEALIFEKDVEFSLGNAACYHSYQTKSAGIALECDWACVFEEGDPKKSKYLPEQSKDISEDEEKKERWKRMFAKVKRLRNAEFLYPEKVPVSRIVRVYFPFKEDMEEAKSFCGASLRPKLVSDISKFEFFRWGAR